MLLTDQAAIKACIGKRSREHVLVRGQGRPVGPQAVVTCVFAGEQGSSGRAAHGVLHVTRFKACPLAGKAVQIRSLDVRVPIAAKTVKALLIGT